MSFISNIKRFKKYDIRNKLLIIGKKIRIKLYPSLFHRKGFKKIYSKLLFNLIINEKFKKLKKYNYENIFEEDINESKINFLIALPRSGSNLVRNLLSSYIELFYKIGNGIPKYDGLRDIWIRPISPITEANLFNQIELNRNLNSLKFISYEVFKKKRVLFSRHPVQNADLYNINLARPVIMVRNPKDQIKSLYIINHFKWINRYKQSEYDLHLNEINKMIIDNSNYYKFWKNFVKNKVKNQDYIVINFLELQKSTKNIFTKILDFYHYEQNQDYISKSVDINSKENYLKYFGEDSNDSIRFTKKQMFDSEKLNKHLTNNVLLDEAIENFNFINEIN